MMPKQNQTNSELNRIEGHLKEEYPLLVDVVESFKELDLITRKLGFFQPEESHTERIPWWPVISVLGLYSSGKSAFVNHYLKYHVQVTGNQAVDDKFTVICFTSEDMVRVLPSLALDADPRFPFFKISEAIEEATPGEGRRVDAYLQLKTCPSEQLKGMIFIDSPGFDADSQRKSVLRITDHIIDLSDLVLVFFDARHPESGSMHDTLNHLVKGTINRRDSSKFLYILNQIDTTANENNPEQVFAAWQRALAQSGLTAGRCYTIYNPEFAVSIEDEGLKARFESKRDTELTDIYNRIEQVKVEREYRIVGMLEQTAHLLEKEIIPRIRQQKDSWRRWIMCLDGLILGAIAVAYFMIIFWTGYGDEVRFKISFSNDFLENPTRGTIIVAAFLVMIGSIHFFLRRVISNRILRTNIKEKETPDQYANYERAFRKNTRWWRSLFSRKPTGSGKGTMKRLAKVVEDTNLYIRMLNDRYTNPSGGEKATSPEMQKDNSSEQRKQSITYIF